MTDNYDIRRKELELKERELLLKERELRQKERQTELTSKAIRCMSEGLAISVGFGICLSLAIIFDRSSDEIICSGLLVLGAYIAWVIVCKIFKRIKSDQAEKNYDPPPEYRYQSEQEFADTAYDAVNFGWSIDKDTSSLIIFSKGKYRVALSKQYRVLQPMNPNLNYNFKTFSEIEAWIKKGCPTL